MSVRGEKNQDERGQRPSSRLKVLKLIAFFMDIYLVHKIFPKEVMIHQYGWLPPLRTLTKCPTTKLTHGSNEEVGAHGPQVPPGGDGGEHGRVPHDGDDGRDPG